MSITLDTSTKALREFAYTMAIALVIIFCIFLPWLFSRTIPMWPLLLATILLLQAITYPPSLIPVQQVWMHIGRTVGWINTRIILAAIFFVLITPLGYLQRKCGKLNYILGVEPKLKTYKISRPQRLTAKDLENPF